MYQTIDSHNRVDAPLKYEVVTAPAVEPVTFTDLVNAMRVPANRDRDLIDSLELMARAYIEEITNYTFITTEFDLWMDFFPNVIYLPAKPAQSVTYIKYIDGNGVQQTLDTTRYQLDSKGPRPIIIPPLGQFFPVAKVQTVNAVQVRFKAGFGDTAALVPDAYKTLIKSWVALNYVDAANIVLGRQPAKIPDTFSYLLRASSLPEV